MTNPDEPHPTRKAFVLPRAKDFVDTVRGRGVPWLGRLLGALIAPILRWRILRELRKHDPAQRRK
jgi:hypothetical protein